MERINEDASPIACCGRSARSGCRFPIDGDQCNVGGHRLAVGAHRDRVLLRVRQRSLVLHTVLSERSGR
jgi:hypothetical protein